MCLVYGGQIVKTIKATKLHHENKKLGKLSNFSDQTSQPNVSNLFNSSLKLNNNCFVHFTLPTLKKSFGKHINSNHGIMIFISSKLFITDFLSNECLTNLKTYGVQNFRYISATGECSIGDSGFQGEFTKEVSCEQISCNQNTFFWNESVNCNSGRVYQWLNVN